MVCVLSSFPEHFPHKHGQPKGMNEDEAWQASLDPYLTWISWLWVQASSTCSCTKNTDTYPRFSSLLMDMQISWKQAIFPNIPTQISWKVKTQYNETTASLQFHFQSHKTREVQRCFPVWLQACVTHWFYDKDTTFSTDSIQIFLLYQASLKHTQVLFRC